MAAGENDAKIPSGFILVNKPPGPTSHDVVDELRAITGISQIGHAGTLDPLAEGLLIILIGQYTKEAQNFVKLSKAYRAVLRLGFESNTHDIDGEIIQRKEFTIPIREDVEIVLEKFRGLEHRLEFVGEKNGVIFYNDSLATVPEAVIQALKTLPDTETLIAGGYDRGLDYSGIGEYLNKGQIKTLILFAPSGKRIWEEIRKATSEANRPEKFDVITMEQAVKIAAAETKPGKICLLSPASASFGTFKDYKDRGEQFKKAINEISNF